MPPCQASTRTVVFRLVVACLLYLIFVQVFAARQVGRNTAAADYRSFYAAGCLVRTEPAHLYDIREQARVQKALVSPDGVTLPYYHPAYEALLYAPLSLLDYQTSYRLMLALNVALAGLVMFLLPGITTLRAPVLRLYPAAGVFAFVPVLIAIVEGQDSILYLLLCCIAWRYFERRADFIAGLVLGLMLFRFQLTLPLLALLLLRRRGLLLPGFLLGMFSVATVSISLVGVAGTRTLYQLLLTGSMALDGGAAARAMAIHPLSMPNLRGLVYAFCSFTSTANATTLLVAVVSLLAAAWTARRSVRLRKDAQAFAAALLCSMLVSYHMNLYDLSLLILPVLLLRTRAALWLAASVCVAAFVTVFYLGASTYYLLALPEGLLLLTAGESSSSTEVILPA